MQVIYEWQKYFNSHKKTRSMGMKNTSYSPSDVGIYVVAV